MSYTLLVCFTYDFADVLDSWGGTIVHALRCTGRSTWVKGKGWTIAYMVDELNLGIKSILHMWSAYFKFMMIVASKIDDIPSW